MMKCVLPVLEMSCTVCAGTVESVVKNLQGVKSATVNFAAESLVVEYDPDTITLENIRAAVQAAGYDLVISDSHIEAQREAADKRRYQKLRRRITVAWACALPLIVLSMFFISLPGIKWVLLALTLPILLYSGAPFYVRAYKTLRQGKAATMDTLVAMSTAMSFLLSLFTTLFPQYWEQYGIEAHVYYEAAGMIVAFVLTGKFLEERTRRRASSALKSLIGLQPQTAMKIGENGVQEVDITTLKAGDKLYVRSGEKVPVDGIVADGTSYVDESMINGEPIPAVKTTGDKVLAGTINQNGALTLEAQAVGSGTLLAQIIRRVQEAQGSKAPVQHVVDRVSAYFVPTVIGIAVLTFLCWYLLYDPSSAHGNGVGGLAYAALTALSVLVVACPCALGLATPIALTAGIGRAAREHILIKDAVALEKMGKVDCVVLDKTGTITQGSPAVTDMIWLCPESERLVSLLVSAEAKSAHPLAQAVVRHFAGRNIPETPLDTFTNVTGKGIEVAYKDKHYRIGNRSFAGISELPEDTEKEITRWRSEGRSVIYYGDTHTLFAVISIADPIKENSAAAIRELQKQGIEVCMLTGDDTLTAQATAAHAGIARLRAEALPQDKEDFVRSLQEQGRTVAMVGDGINDSQALACADVSVAMGHGSDIAMEVAMITLMTSDLSLLARTIRLSRRTMRIVHENLFWAFIYNIICIPIAAGILLLFSDKGMLLTPMWASAAMAFSSISVVLNSLRLTRK